MVPFSLPYRSVSMILTLWCLYTQWVAEISKSNRKASYPDRVQCVSLQSSYSSVGQGAVNNDREHTIIANARRILSHL